jgi:hypothetical protein
MKHQLRWLPVPHDSAGAARADLTTGKERIVVPDLIPARRSRLGVSRLEREVYRALELAEANSVVIAGRQVARIRATGQVARAGMAELAIVNEAEQTYGYDTDEVGRMRLGRLADTAEWVLTDITREMSRR